MRKNLKKVLFLIPALFFFCCSEVDSKFIEPTVTFSKNYVQIENNSGFDYYNVEIKFADKYNLAYLDQSNKSKIKFKYTDITPPAKYRELSKNKFEINFQDSVGNNYLVKKNKVIYTNLASSRTNAFLNTLNSVVTSSGGITVLLALLAAFVALHQVKSNVISSSRIKWIEEFKNNISQHNNATSQSIFFYGMYRKYRGDGEKPTAEADKYYNEYIKFHYLANIYEANLFINLNPEEIMYKNIQTTLSAIRKTIDDMDKDSDYDEVYKEVSMKLHTLRIQSQKALKVEWKKSKKMFYVNWFK